MNGQSDERGGRAAPDAPALDSLIGHKDISSSHPAVSNKASLAFMAQSALDLSNSGTGNSFPSSCSSSFASFATSTNTSGDGGDQRGNDPPQAPQAPQPPHKVYARSTASGNRCVRCIIHKKKCDGVRPVCGYCVSSRHHKYDCMYPQGNPTRRQLEDMRRQQTDTASGAGGQQNGDNNNSNMNTSAATASPSTTAQPARLTPPLYVRELSHHLSRMRQAHIAAAAADAREQAGNNPSNTLAGAPNAIIHPLAPHAMQPIPSMATRQQYMPSQMQVVQGMTGIQAQGVGLQCHTSQAAGFQASQAHCLPLRAPGHPDQPAPSQSNLDPQPPIALDLNHSNAMARRRNRSPIPQRNAPRQGGLSHDLMPPPMFMSTNVVEIARQEFRLLPDGSLTFQPAINPAMIMTPIITATNNMTNSMGGQSPARFPEMNWGPHDVYTSDGALNANPPHGDCTSETVIGQLDAPVRQAADAGEQGEQSKSEDEEVASSSADEEEEEDGDDVDAEDGDEEQVGDDVDREEDEEHDEEMLHGDE